MMHDQAGELHTNGEILVVEDTPASLKLLTMLLTGAGYRVRQAPSGELALWTARSQPPELILLDVRMPGMDGYEVCRQLKEMPELKEVPVIFLSAYNDTDDKLRGFQVGGVDFISKPYQFEEVNARVMAHLKIGRLQQKLAYQNDNLHQLVEAKAHELSQTRLSLLAERQQRDYAERESRLRLAEIAHMNRNASATVYCAALVHELNQPLAAIMSNAEAAELFMKMDPPALGEVAEILADIRRDDLRASELISRMRELLKKSEAAASVLNLNDLVLNTTALLTSEARMRKIALRHALAPQPLPVAADRIQLQQVMINLTLNGMDAMGASCEGEREIEIQTRVRDGREVEVRVRDHGCGFAGNLERVFESFFTTKPQGMGLGLSISAAIVAAHGGRVWAENHPEGGATVSFRLPLHSGEQA
ncbi:MAG: response regulator [Pseudomonadota bacterium]